MIAASAGSNGAARSLAWSREPQRGRGRRDQPWRTLVWPRASAWVRHTDSKCPRLRGRDAGGRDRWVRGKLPEPYPLDVDDAELIGDLVLSMYFADARLARQCPKCGALHVDLDKEGRGRQTLTQVGTRPSRVLAVIPTDTGHD